jgi:hypothetical protein
MAIETATYISDLDQTRPSATDPKSEGDDQLRLIKSTIKATFPSVTGAVTVSHTQLNSIPSLATLASPALTGTPTVPTAAVATSTTQAASTAFVQTAIAAVNAQAAPTTLSVSNAASVALTAGQHDVATYSGAVTWTLPAAPSAGQQIAVTPGNGLYSNVVSRNGEKIMGLSEDMTIDNPSVTVFFRYINSTLGWRIA